MFNCKIAIAQFSAVVLVSAVVPAYATEKVEVGTLASTAAAQPEKVSKSTLRSRYGNTATNGSVVIAVQPFERSGQRVRSSSAASLGAATPALADSSVTSSSVSATKRTRYPTQAAANEVTRLADLKR